MLLLCFPSHRRRSHSPEVAEQARARLDRTVGLVADPRPPLLVWVLPKSRKANAHLGEGMLRPRPPATAEASKAMKGEDPAEMSHHLQALRRGNLGLPARSHPRVRIRRSPEAGSLPPPQHPAQTSVTTQETRSQSLASPGLHRASGNGSASQEPPLAHRLPHHSILIDRGQLGPFPGVEAKAQHSQQAKRRESRPSVRQPLAGLQADPTPTLSTSTSQLPGGKHSVSSPLCAQHGVWSGRGQLRCGHNLGVKVGRPGGPELLRLKPRLKKSLACHK